MLHKPDVTGTLARYVAATRWEVFLDAEAAVRGFGLLLTSPLSRPKFANIKVASNKQG